MPGFLSPGKGMPLLLIPEYSGINKSQRVPGRSKTAHRKTLVKCFLTTMQETGDQSLGQEDPLEKEMATNSTILA